jgi:hypothetical protein
MNSTRIKRIAVGVALVAASSGGVAAAVASTGSSSPHRVQHHVKQHQVQTPNSCIEMNQGDYAACNVGNSGSGSAPYRAPK